jgi:hypothetical protein
MEVILHEVCWPVQPGSTVHGIGWIVLDRAGLRWIGKVAHAIHVVQDMMQLMHLLHY